MRETTLNRWFQDAGFALRQASDSARACDLDAARYLNAASGIAFWNADSINQVLIYGREGALEMADVPDNIPVVTSVEAAELERGEVDGQLLPKLLRLTFRPNVERAMKNGGLPEGEFKSVYGPAWCAATWTMPALVIAACNRICIKLMVKNGLMPPEKPKFPFPTVEDRERPDLYCPVCGEVYYAREKDGETGKISFFRFDDDDWECYCGARFNSMLSYPGYWSVY